MRAQSVRSLALVALGIAVIAALFVRREESPGEVAPVGVGTDSNGPVPQVLVASPTPVERTPGGGSKSTSGADAPALTPVPQPIAEPKASLRVHGHVRTSSGGGVEGLVVSVRGWSGKGLDAKWSSRETRSGALGAFETHVDRALVDAALALVTDGEGYVEAVQTVPLDTYDETRGIDVVVERARAIAGRVVDADARAIAGSTVQLWYGSDSTWPTPVDAEGRFTTPARAPRGAFELIVEAPGFPRRSVVVAAAAEERTDVGDIVFERGGSVAGVVVDARGEPVEDLVLVVDRTAGTDRSKPHARTDARGRFEIEDVGRGVVGLWIDPTVRGGSPQARRCYRGGVGGVEVGRRDVRIVAETECVLVLNFVSAATGAAQPLTRAEYGFAEAGAPPPPGLPNGAGPGSPFTSTRMSVPSGHRYDVYVRAPGFEESTRSSLIVGDEEELPVEIRLRPRR